VENIHVRACDSVNLGEPLIDVTIEIRNAIHITAISYVLREAEFRFECIQKELDVHAQIQPGCRPIHPP
jgi:hypothetical protein